MLAFGASNQVAMTKVGRRRVYINPISPAFLGPWIHVGCCGPEGLLTFYAVLGASGAPGVEMVDIN